MHHISRLKQLISICALIFLGLSCSRLYPSVSPTAFSPTISVERNTLTPAATHTEIPTDTPTPPPVAEQKGEPVVSVLFYPLESVPAFTGASLEAVLEAIPSLMTIVHRSDGSVESVSTAWTDFTIAEMRFCFSFDVPCELGDKWIPFELSSDSVHLGGSLRQNYAFKVDWIGPRILWAKAQFRDANKNTIPSFASTFSTETPQDIAQISMQINGIWNEATPVIDQPAPVQTAIAGTKTAFPVTGSVLLAGGASATGGVAGETIQIQAVFTSTSPYGKITQMRVKNAGGCVTDPSQMEGAKWEPFTTTRSFPVSVAINWVGFYVAVQYQDEKGNLSPVYCDDISVEGMPPTPSATHNLSAVGDPWWQPSPDRPIHWQWQLSDTFVYPRDVRSNITVYDLDGELTSADIVSRLHALDPDIKVICYFDAGVYEPYRSDASSFPASVIGNPVEGWEDLYWLDIRQLDILLPILSDRIEHWCKDKGFDAIEPDDTEVWSNNSGFPVTKDDNFAFNIQIASLAHSFGLSVGLKNNTAETPELWQYFDWALNEQCWEYDECTSLKDSFLANGKAVFNIEYDQTPNCSTANAWHMNSARRDLNLVGPANPDFLYQPCIPDAQADWELASNNWFYLPFVAH